MTSDIVSNILLIVLILTSLAWGISSIQNLRHRLKVQKRIALLRTTPDEIPLYPEQPLQLALTPTVLTRKLSWKGHLLFFACWFGVVMVVEVITLLIAPITSTPLSDTLLAGVLIFIFFGAFMIALHALFAVMFYQRVEARETELIVQRGFIRRQLSWDQARLFAVDQTKDINNTISHWDELSGDQKVVRWEHNAEISPWTALKFSPPEYRQELACLRNYIRAKTDLPLRDLRQFRT